MSTGSTTSGSTAPTTTGTIQNMTGGERNFWIGYAITAAIAIIVTWVVTSGLEALLTTFLIAAVAVAFFLLQLFEGAKGHFSFGETFAGIVLLLVGLLAGSSPTWVGSYSSRVWNMAGIGLMSPVTNDMYKVESGHLVPVDVPTGQILVLQIDQDPPVFITGRVPIADAKEVHLYLQNLRTGGTSPPVFVGER